ncbi:MAG: hypothetical protein WCO60_10325 [Verrucomicrobiota bacterium]
MRSTAPLLASILALSPLCPQPSLAASASAELQKALNSAPEESNRLTAFSKLEAAGTLDAQQIIRSITDTSPLVRAQALRVGTALAVQDPELELRLLALAHDRSAPVRLQLLSSLPKLPNPKSNVLFLQVLSAEIENPAAWPIAIASLKDNLWPTLLKLHTEPSWKKDSIGRSRFLELATNSLRESGSIETISAIFDFCADSTPPDQRWFRLALLRGLLGRTPAPKEPVPKTVHLDSIPPSLQTLLSSKDSDIRKILTAPEGLILWPSSQ